MDTSNFKTLTISEVLHRIYLYYEDFSRCFSPFQKQAALKLIPRDKVKIQDL